MTEFEATAETLRNLAASLSNLDVVFALLDDMRTGRSRLTSDEEEMLGANVNGSDVVHQYARIVNCVVESLSTLPQFSDGLGLAGLRTLRSDLVTTDEGHHAERLKPPHRDRKPGTPAGRRVYQAQVIECVRLLEEIGLSITEARHEVARIFNAAGHRGQQGALSPETLTRWREDVLGPDSSRAAGRRLIEAKLAAWRASPMWPPSRENALAYVAARAANPVISLAASK